MHRILIALVFLVTACKKDPSVTGSDAKKAMGLYAKGYNSLLEDPKRMLKDYFSSFPNDGLPDPKNPPHLTPDSFAASKIKEAKDAFAEAKEARPDTLAKLDAPAQAAVDAMEKAAAAIDQVGKYYQAETFKDDKGAKAKELHAQLVAADKAFGDAIHQLGDGLSTIEDQQATDEIAKYADDKDYSYWYRYYDQQAKKFLTVVEGGDKTKLAPAKQALDGATAELQAFVAKKGGKLHSSFKTFADRADAFAAEATKLMRDGDVDKAYDPLVSAYNQLIGMGNTLAEIEGVNALKDQ
jgi:uncharacterized protein DUF3829